MAKPSTQNGFKVVDIRAIRQQLEALAIDTGASMTTILQAAFAVASQYPDQLSKRAIELQARKSETHKHYARLASKARQKGL
jgi:tRNA(Phe) wybutosine-synthesizing methylase Tyw3